MASTDSGQNLTIKQKLLTQSKSFNFYQAVRLLEALAKHQGKSLKLSPKLSLSFPGADVDSIAESSDAYQLTATFLGLYSSDSPLPIYYVEDLLRQLDNDNTTVKEFLDIFHQRIYELLFHVWCKYRLAYQIYERNNHSLQRIIYNIAGLSFNAHASLLTKFPEMARYIRFFPAGNRTLANLQFLLADYFSLPVQVESFYPEFIVIHHEQRNQLGKSQNQIGESFYLGRLFQSINSNILIRFSDLTREQGELFMPNETNAKKLYDILKTYLNKPLNYYIEFTLLNNALIPAQLGQKVGLGEIIELGSTNAAPSDRKPVKISYQLQ